MGLAAHKNLMKPLLDFGDRKKNTWISHPPFFKHPQYQPWFTSRGRHIFGTFWNGGDEYFGVSKFPINCSHELFPLYKYPWFYDKQMDWIIWMGDGCKDIEMKQFSTPSGMNSRRSRLAVALQYFHFFRACNGWGGGAGGTQIAFLCHGGALKSSNFGCYGKTHGFGVAIFEDTSIWGRMHHLGGGTFGARNPTTFLNGPRYQCCLIFVWK